MGKKYIFVLIACITLSFLNSYSFSMDNYGPVDKETSETYLSSTDDEFSLSSVEYSELSEDSQLAYFEILYRLERRGCCSHHGGVCGCENGRAVCCDGTISPSCGCD